MTAGSPKVRTKLAPVLETFSAKDAWPLPLAPSKAPAPPVMA
jgi:hypothetical protein